jgi:2-polyprenyl-6-methoxyphenol hydroxylase-like FAD-dependent oxidoreductase
MVEELRRWPEHHITIGTEGDLVFSIVPHGGGRVRLYLLWSHDQPRRFAGPSGPRACLNSFAFACIPESEGIVQARPAGPCATYPMNDSWTDCLTVDGLALIGDAAGYSDPHIGQGLSVALRDVRVLSELLLAHEDWSPSALRPYAEERAERLRRLRFCNMVATTLRVRTQSAGAAPSSPGSHARGAGARPPAAGHPGRPGVGAGVRAR